MFVKRTILAGAGALTLTCLCASAQNAIPAMNDSISDGQKAVVTYFTQDSIGDVQLGNLGVQKSKNAAVLSLARAMVRDHTATAQNGMRTARSIGAGDVRWKPGDDNVLQLTRLSRYSGAQFDREYIKTLIEAHRIDIGTAQDAMEFVSAPALRTYLQQTLSVDRRHLRMAQSAQTTM
jgi:putative membrane protein